MKLLFLIVTVVLFCNNGKAQKKHLVALCSYNSIGFVAGKLPIAFAAQTENGVRFKNWFVGAGLGIDLYYKETLPLFAAVKKEFPFKNNCLFFYVNAGRNIVAKHKIIVGTFSTVETNGGFYADAGIGYKIKTSKKSNIFFSLGNTEKNIGQTEFSSDIFGMPGVFDTQYKFRRIAFKLGYQF